MSFVNSRQERGLELVITGLVGEYDSKIQTAVSSVKDEAKVASTMNTISDERKVARFYLRIHS